eukprot:3574910-Rhodomonas_salina.2
MSMMCAVHQQTSDLRWNRTLPPTIHLDHWQREAKRDLLWSKRETRSEGRCASDANAPSSLQASASSGEKERDCRIVSKAAGRQSDPSHSLDDLFIMYNKSFDLDGVRVCNNDNWLMP